MVCLWTENNNFATEKRPQFSYLCMYTDIAFGVHQRRIITFTCSSKRPLKFVLQLQRYDQWRKMCFYNQQSTIIKLFLKVQTWCFACTVYSSLSLIAMYTYTNSQRLIWIWPTTTKILLWTKKNHEYSKYPTKGYYSFICADTDVAFGIDQLLFRVHFFCRQTDI